MCRSAHVAAPVAVLAVLLLFVRLAFAQAIPPPPAPPMPPPPPTGAGAPAPAAPAAAPQSPDEKKAEARAHFEKAVAIFDEEAWDAALAELVKSLELFPTRAATKNAAICLRKLHRYDESLDMFEKLLKDFQNIPPEDRELAGRQIKDLRGLVGAIEVRGAEQGALIVVDGRERGKFPAPPLRVSAGTHVLRVYKEGLAPFETRVEIAGGQTSAVEAKLAPLAQSGRLNVTETSGKQLEVVVDSVVVGKTPWAGPLAVGEHTVALRGEGNVGTQPASVPIKLDAVMPLALTAEELDAQVRIEPLPAGASVAVDGVVVGRGIWEGRLRAGMHRVEVAAEGFLPVTRQVALARGAREIVGVQLDRDPTSPLWRAANPPKIYFEVDGALAIAPLYGGDIDSPPEGCTGSCQKTTALGALVRLHAGYQLGMGLGFGLDAGYLTMSEKITGRSAALRPVGLAQEPGTVDDKLSISGVMFGASGAFHRGKTFPFLARLGAGVFVGSAKDERSGTFTTTNPLSAGQQFSAAASESPGATYLYIAPEVRIGVRFADHIEVFAGVTGVFMKSLKDPTWKDQSQITSSDGVSKFGAQTVAGSTMVVVAPMLGARYDF